MKSYLVRIDDETVVEQGGSHIVSPKEAKRTNTFRKKPIGVFIRFLQLGRCILRRSCIPNGSPRRTCI